MKLAIVTETFPPEINGVAMTFGAVAGELGRRGHCVAVFRPWRRDLPDALVAAGVRLATDPTLRNRLRIAGRAAVEAQSWETVIAQFERDLEDAAGKTRAAAAPSPALA